MLSAANELCFKAFMKMSPIKRDETAFLFYPLRWAEQVWNLKTLHVSGRVREDLPGSAGKRTFQES